MQDAIRYPLAANMTVATAVFLVLRRCAMNTRTAASRRSLNKYKSRLRFNPPHTITPFYFSPTSMLFSDSAKEFVSRAATLVWTTALVTAENAADASPIPGLGVIPKVVRDIQETAQECQDDLVSLSS